MAMAPMSALPALPEKTVRLSDDMARASTDSDRRRMFRNTYQSTRSTSSINNNTAPITEENLSPDPLRPASVTPAAQQNVQWQSQSGDLGVSPALNSVNYSPNNSILGRDQQVSRSPFDGNISGDYSASAGYDATPQRKEEDSTIFFGGKAKEKALPLAQDNASVRSVLPRYQPLANGTGALRRPQSMLSSRQNPWDVFDPDEGAATNDGRNDGTPSKTKPKRLTSFYVVRKGGDDGDRPTEEVLRLPFTYWLQGSLRNHLVAFLGELVGTCMFLFFAFAGTIVANVGAQKSVDNTTTNSTVGYSPIVNLYVAASFGFSLLVNVWIFFRVSGGLFNPAVTLGMVMTKTIPYSRGFLLFIAQITGAILASFLVSVMFPADFNVRTTLADDTSIAQGVFIEMILTAELVFTIFMLAKEKHKATYMAPIGIGMALLIAELAGVFFTGGSLNPARSFGPCVVDGRFDEEHWIYWVGPTCGTLVAYAFYRFIKILEYEMANPGQDSSNEEEKAETAGLIKYQTSLA